MPDGSMDLGKPQLQGIPVGGRLQLFWETWLTMGCDPWVVRVLRYGYSFTFVNPPPLSAVVRPSSLPNDQTRRQAIREQVDLLLSQRVIEQVRKLLSPGFYSRFFVVPKDDGGRWRAIWT